MLASADRLDQIEQMRAGVDYRIEARVKNFVVSLRPLTMSEVVVVANRVNDHLMRMPENLRNDFNYSNFMARETIKEASTSDYGVHDPRITDPILDRMLPGEVQLVYRQYVQACDRANPVLEQMPKGELEAIVSELKKNEFHLTELSFLELVNVCRHLIQGD